MTLSSTSRQHSALVRLHNECEMNYLRLLRLLPDMSEGAMVRVRHCTQRIAAMSLRVGEVSRYTCVIDVRIERDGPQWLPDVELRVRVYHDARMAEVIAWCSDRTIPWAMSERPGKQSRDEKWQWNRFLCEVLSYSLSHGLADAELKVEFDLG